MLRWTTTEGPAATRTALIVPVPVLDAVVGRHRSSLDTAARWGVPAHVTVLYPFLDPVDAMTGEAQAAVRRAVASVPVFDCAFRRTAWFGDDVLWLAPVPAEPFVSLTRAVWDAFPQTPPYGGTHDDIVPHLTVGELRNGTPQQLLQAEADVGPALPVAATVEQVWLVAGDDQPGSWRLAGTFPLAQ